MISNHFDLSCHYHYPQYLMFHHLNHFPMNKIENLQNASKEKLTRFIVDHKCGRYCIGCTLGP